jgi:hypothetical protein
MPYHKIDRVALVDIKGDGRLTAEEKRLISRTWKKKSGLFRRVVDWTRRHIHG